MDELEYSRNNDERSYEDIVDEIRKKVKADIDLNREISDRDVRQAIVEAICRKGKDVYLGVDRRRQIEKEVFNSLRKLDVLQELLEDDSISEIMINGADKIFVEKEGKLVKIERGFSDPEKLEDIIQRIVAVNNKIVNESVPIVDTRLPDGSRVNIVLPPVAIDGGAVSIRKFPKESIDMKKLVGFGTISPEIRDYLEMLVKSRYNLFISGSTSSGKTTFLNALTEFIPESERIITIEDSAELKVIGNPNLVRLESRNKNLEGRLEISIRDLVRTSLRMRPDRLIIGECRGPETFEMLQAFNTGHDGGISTGHGNSTEDMISRLMSMSLMAENLPLEVIKSQIVSGLDIIIHLVRLPSGERKVQEISELTGLDNGEIKLERIYELKGDKWEKTGVLKNIQKARDAGFSIF